MDENVNSESNFNENFVENEKEVNYSIFLLLRFINSRVATLIITLPLITEINIVRSIGIPLPFP